MISESLELRFVNIQQHRIRVGETDANYRHTAPHNSSKTVGNSDTPLLLFNGIGAPIESALPFIRELNATQVITLDVPGVGQSPRPSIPYRLSSLTTLVSHMLDKLGYQQVNVLGISWGGCLAQQFAYDYPQRCQQLVLAVTSAGSFMVPGSPSMLLKMLSPWRFITPQGMSEIGPPKDGKRTANYDRAVDTFARQLFGGSKRSYLLQLMAVTGWSSLPWLHKLALPTLVMMGEDDPIVPAINGKILCRRLPDARMRMFQGGHLFMLTQPASAASHVEAFLTKTDTHRDKHR